MNFPTAHLEVKIVPSIPFRRSVLNASFRRVRILLCHSMEGLEDDSQAEYHEISPNVFDHYHSLLSSSFRGHPGEINHPVFGSGFAAIHGTVTFPGAERSVMRVEMRERAAQSHPRTRREDR